MCICFLNQLLGTWKKEPSAGTDSTLKFGEVGQGDLYVKGIRKSNVKMNNMVGGVEGKTVKSEGADSALREDYSNFILAMELFCLMKSI